MIYILFNPLANNGDGLQGLDAVAASLRTRHPGQEPTLFDVTKQPAAELLLGLTARDEAVVCGGDGTLHRLINDLEGRTPAAPVYAWRMGTGNDFIRDVLGPSDTERVLLNDYIKNLPRAQAGQERRRFLNNVSFGLDGQVCELGEQERQRMGRPVNYIALALRLVLRDYVPSRAAVTVDGQERSYERVWVASAFNGKYVGGGKKLAPDQDRRSDKLCVVVLHSLSRPMALLDLPKAFSGDHVDLPQCDIRFGHQVHIRFERPTALNMDGEVLGRFTEFSAEK